MLNEVEIRCLTHCIIFHYLTFKNSWQLLPYVLGHCICAAKCCTINFIPYAWIWAEHIALHTSEFIRIHPTSTSSVNTSVMSSQYLLSQGHFSMVNLHKDILCQLESAIQLAWVFLYYGKDPVINNHRCAQWTIRLFDVAKLIFFIPLIVLKLFIQPPLKFLLSQCWISFFVAAGGLFLLHWYLLIS